MSKNPIKKPNIDYNPKRSVSYNKIEDNKIIFDPPVIDKNYLLKHLALAKENIEKTLEVFESSALQYAVTTNDLTVKSASRILNSNVSNSQNITYPTYLYSLTQDGISANLVSSVYETKSIGLWGNYSIKAIKLLDKSNKELDNIKAFLDSTEIENSITYPIIMQNINVARGISERLKEVRNPKLSISDIKKEYEGYGKSELIGVQIALNEQIIKVGEKIERDESLLKSEVSDTAKYYYDNIANRSLNSGITFANKTGKFSNIISNFIGLFDSEQKRINEDLTDRAIAFSEQASKIADDIVELATLQIYNQAIVEAGGAEEIDVVETYRDLPDQLVVDTYINQLSGEGQVSTFISSVTSKNLEDIRDIFVENKTFNYLKSLLFWGDTVEINGGNIKAGTIEAGAIKIGDRPMSLSITWGENQEEAGASSPVVGLHLSHTDGVVSIEYDGGIKTNIINAAEVLLEDSSTPSDPDTSYWIYITFDEPIDGIATILSRVYDNTADGNNKPEGDNIAVIGIWENELLFGTLMTSYGSTIINGNKIITGTVVADYIRVSGEPIDGSTISESINNANQSIGILEDNLFWGDTTEIDGSNIRTGTVSAGSLSIGERNVSITGRFSPNTTDGTTVDNGHLYYPGGLLYVPGFGENLTITGADVVALPVASETYWIYADILGSLDQDEVFIPTSATIASGISVPADSETHKYKNIGIWTLDNNSYGVLSLSIGQTFINGDEITTGTISADLVSIESTQGGVRIDGSGIFVNQGTFRMSDSNNNEIMLYDGANLVDDHSFEILARYYDPANSPLGPNGYGNYVPSDGSWLTWAQGEMGIVTGTTGANTSIICEDRNWDVNFFVGDSIFIEDRNSMYFEERTITSNTSNTITFSPGVPTIPIGGGSFQFYIFSDYIPIITSNYEEILSGSALFGTTSVIATKKHISQIVPIPIGINQTGPYTLSFYASRFEDTQADTNVNIRVLPMIVDLVEILDNVGWNDTFLVKSWNYNDPVVGANSLKWERFVFTFNNIPANTDGLFIEISTSSNSVLIDGAQLVPFGNATAYDPEASFMRFMSGQNTSGPIAIGLENEYVHFVGQTGEPGFTNNWTNVYQYVRLCSFEKQRTGNIMLSGFIGGGTVGTATPIFQLPSEYRPISQKVFAVANNSTFGCITITPDGYVSAAYALGGNTWISLDGILYNQFS
jgi:hypothetical protein